ncbi:MAG: DUF3833 domain-containing protein [Pseudomonadota bacterium]
MHTIFKILTVCGALLSLSACASLSIDGPDYTSVQPTFVLEEFFDGDVKAWGIVQDRSGEVIQRFEVDIAGSVSDGVLTLDETFRYGLGSGVEKRIWTINVGDGKTYTGSAGDIVGQADGQSFGNAFFWGYEMDLPVGNSKRRVKFADWIWAFDENTIVNRSYIQKFGITFAEVTIFMRKD